MYKVLVLYGAPASADAFDRYYADQHVPLASRIPGLTRWTVTRFEPGPDDTPPPYYYAAELYAETREALEAALATEEGLAAQADVAHFATGGAVFCFGPEEEIPVGHAADTDDTWEIGR